MEIVGIGNHPNCASMVRFAQAFQEPGIVSALRRQLSWTHFKQLIYVEDELNPPDESA